MAQSPRGQPTLWKHWLTLYKPDGAIGPTALLFITGGNNDGKAPKLSADLAAIATTKKTVVAELRMVPNQPLTFTGDAYGPRKEDEIIATPGIAISRRVIPRGRCACP